MMHRKVPGLLVAFAACPLLAGCIADPPESDSTGEDVGTAEGAVVNGNALNLNALNLNALNLNALNLNALNLNALSPQAMASLQDPGPTGALAREAFKYMVSCALTPSDSVSFSWTDSAGLVHDEVYYGLIGLTPNWNQGPLVTSEAKWISACLASRVNWYQVSVELSSRGTNNALNLPGAAEVADFTKKEGGFWGNLFTTSPAVFACYTSSGITNARAQLRDCAAGHLNAEGAIETCGMIQLVGDCTTYCNHPQPDYGYHAHCGTTPGAPDSSTQVVTVFLR